MKQEIEQLEKQLAELKKAYEKKEYQDYVKSPHKVFKEGDIITNGIDTGIVGWVENKHMNITADMGYMGVGLISGTRGFASPLRRDEWELVNDPYYHNNHKIEIELTGLEIEGLLYYIGPENFNSNPAKTKLIKLLRSFREK